MKAAMLAASLAVVFGTPATAVPIDYIFTGTATGTVGLGQTAFSGAFRVDIFGDTTNVQTAAQSINNATSATFSVPGSSGTFLNGSVRVNSDPQFPIIIFGQSFAGPPFFVAEGAINSAFATYDLKTAFPLTPGDPSFITQTFATDQGDLTFTGASAISFEAVIEATPIPGTFALFGTGLAAFGTLGWRRRKKALAA